MTLRAMARSLGTMFPSSSCKARSISLKRVSQYWIPPFFPLIGPRPMILRFPGVPKAVAVPQAIRARCAHPSGMLRRAVIEAPRFRSAQRAVVDAGIVYGHAAARVVIADMIWIYI